VFIDYQTGVIEEQHVVREREDAVLKSIGSTLQGVGAAMMDRVARRLKLARDFVELREFLVDTALLLNTALDNGEKYWLRVHREHIYLSIMEHIHM